jgi:hypothetical protein
MLKKQLLIFSLRIPLNFHFELPGHPLNINLGGLGALKNLHLKGLVRLKGDKRILDKVIL